MNFAYIVIGLVIGAYVAGANGEIFFGMVTGAIIGWLLARLKRMDKRISELESYRATRAESITRPSPTAQAAPPGVQPGATIDEPPSRPAEPKPAAAATVRPATASTTSAPLKTPAKRKPVKPPSAGPSLLQQGLGKLASWFTTGNVPVKIGVIVTFIGVAFLLKYSIDRELLVVPIEFRLLAVALLGLGLIAVGWRLRSKMRVYALSLQGGGAGLLFLTIFATFRIWQLLPGPMAFFLLVALTVFTGALAVLQNSRWLAILGMAGGFLAPVLTSTGQGSHVALFSYYLVLNLAILGISWFRAWQSLNLVGFLFTFLIGSLWGYQYYRPELWLSTLPFLAAHFFLYQAIAILFALRQPPGRIGLVDGALVFGTPAICFALQSRLMIGSEYGLAISAAVVAVFYVITARVLWARQSHDLRLLTESFIALAVAFATITLPLALDARWTSAAWALEGAALVWIGMHQRRNLANLAGAVLIGLSGISFLEYGWKDGRGMALVNGNVLGGLMISLSAFFASKRLKVLDLQALQPLYTLARAGLFLWGALWWLATGLMETLDRVPGDGNKLNSYLLFLAISFAGAATLGDRRDWPMMRRAAFAFLPLLVPVVAVSWIVEQHLLHGLGWLAWPLALLAQAWILKISDKHSSSLAATWHFLSLLGVAALLATEAWWWVDDALTDVWGDMAAVTVTGIVALMVWQFRQRPAWPVAEHPVAYLNASLLLVALQAIGLTSMSIDNPGDPAPLGYLPVLNPYDLALLFAVVVVMLSLGAIRREVRLSGTFTLATYQPAYQLMMGVLFFIMTTMALVRGVHHYTQVFWSSASLTHSDIVQTSLSIYWGVLGFTGMLWGARSGRRPVWLAGAAFMALVVIKLFAVDLGNSGTVERIVSFMGIGALLLVVGYFAPVPPKAGRNEPDRTKPGPTPPMGNENLRIEDR